MIKVMMCQRYKNPDGRVRKPVEKTFSSPLQAFHCEMLFSWNRLRFSRLGFCIMEVILSFKNNKTSNYINITKKPR